MPEPIVEPVEPTPPPVEPTPPPVEPTPPPVETPPVEPTPPPVETPPVEPVTDWRTRTAGGDAKFLKRLERFSDEAAYGKSYQAMEQKFSSGEFVKPLPKDATEAEVAVWRKEQGVPSETKGYTEALSLPNGKVLGELDTPIAESFAETALANNWSPAQYGDAVNWYFEFQDKLAADQAGNDDQYHQTNDDALRADWGGTDYRRNLAAIGNLMATWPEGLREAVLSSRTAEGNKLGDHPDFAKTMAELAVKLNPTATLLPATGADPSKGLSDRLSELKGWMGSEKGSEGWKKYWKDDNIQKEYQSLLVAQGQLKAQGG